MNQVIVTTSNLFLGMIADLPFHDFAGYVFAERVFHQI
jgi:hypothetical protein